MSTAPRPRVLTIAGIDPCGGAGLTADARTIQVCGAVALTVPTCWTDQDRTGFRGATAIDDAALVTMLAAVARDGAIDAVKTGLFASARTVSLVARWFRSRDPRPPLVIDPVLSATAGGAPAAALAIAQAIATELAPLAALITPNQGELAALTTNGAGDLLARGAGAVLVTGGDAAGAEVVDVLWTAGGAEAIAHPRVGTGQVHGTGCALSAVLAVALARGEPLDLACRTSVQRVARWITGTAASSDGLATPLDVH